MFAQEQAKKAIALCADFDVLVLSGSAGCLKRVVKNGLRARRLGGLENRKDMLDSQRELYLEWEAGKKHSRRKPEFRAFM